MPRFKSINFYQIRPKLSYFCKKYKIFKPLKKYIKKKNYKRFVALAAGDFVQIPVPPAAVGSASDPCNSLTSDLPL